MIADKANRNNPTPTPDDHRPRAATPDNPVLHIDHSTNAAGPQHDPNLAQATATGQEKEVIYLESGQLTALGEGSDELTKYIHWPDTSASGVTLGKGYDIGSRTPDQVIKELTAAGMDKAQAIKISKGAGLKGNAARDFVQANKQSVGIISNPVQKKLLAMLMVVYESKAKSAATSTTADAQNTNARGREVREGVPAGTYVMTEQEWNNLHPALVELLTDMIYQGGYYRYDRIAKINKILKDNDGDQIAQMKGVKTLLESDYMATYAQSIGEGRGRPGSSETIYGQEVDLSNKYRRNEIRIAYLSYVITNLEQGTDVQFSE